MRKVIESTLVSIDGAGDGLTELRRSVGGAVLAPADAGFDAARRCFNTLVDRRPAVIVRCLDAGDVAGAFDFARAHTVEVAVRGGGHNPAGHCVWWRRRSSPGSAGDGDRNGRSQRRAP